ncbi:response regulator receiver domain-containing protein [Pseudomonas mandelii JR-1]|uniref:Response regulator receiver domain-containing protein n=1 Tax=Pseudomonas mandelii JR-1 TaxID=1147786 RepID=A0A024EEC9_9PSED|nr:response regulator receiver domain-containing protein [Pseudomonas mandelii JR-1]
MLFHKCSTVAFANQIVRLRTFGGSKPLMFKGQHDMAAFLAQSPTPIYRATDTVVFP